jgi:hypothetical protein
MKARTRKRIPSSKFALGGRRYPVDTKKRAANAKARSTQQMKKGKLSKASRNKVHAKANRVLKKGKRR